MPDKTTFKIFVASSNELKEEREKCILLINQLNKSHKHLHLEPVEWEIDMVHSNYPGHENIQDAIDPKLKESDLVVFMFHSKIGKYTREEFEFANKENKRLFAFFKTGFSPDVEELETYGELLKFKKSLNDTVLYKEYDDLDNFEKLFYPNLNLYLVENHPAVMDKADRASVTALSQSNQQLIQLLAAKEQEIKTLKENTNQLPDASLQIKINELSQEKEAIKNELQQSEELKTQLAKDKADLEKQLAPQIEHDKLKSKALEEVNKGNYAEAENYLMQSAKANVEETASTFFELAKLKKLQLQFAEALDFYEMAVKIAPDNTLYLNQAGSMIIDMGNYNRGIKYYEKALAIDKKLLGEDHLHIASSFNNIGLVYKYKGEYDKAIEYYEKSLTIAKKVLGEEDPNNAIRYNNLGGAYYSKGEYNKAIQYYEKALIIDKKFYEEDHPRFAIRYNNIGAAYIAKGEYNKAIQYYQLSLSIDNKFYSRVHPDIAIDYNNIGLAYKHKGEYDKAIKYYEKSLTIGKKFFGEKHPNIAIQYNNIGVVYRNKGEYDKAIEYYEKSMAIGKKIHGEEHPEIATNYNNIGAVFSHKGEYDKAIEFYEKALAIDKKFLGKEHPTIARDYNNIGLAFSDKKEYDKAIELFEKALIIFLKFLPETHPNIQIVKKNIEVVMEDLNNNKH